MLPRRRGGKRGRGRPAARGRGRGRVQKPRDLEVAFNASLLGEVLEEPLRARRRVELAGRMDEDMMREMSEMMQREIQAALRNVLPVVPPAPPGAPPAPIPPPVHVPPPVAPIAPVVQRRQDINDEGMTMLDFIKLKLPKFKGEHREDPTEFVEEVDRVVKHLPCSKAHTVGLMSLQFADSAKIRYEREIEERVRVGNPPTWEEFKEKFLDEFFTEGLKEMNMVRFEQLNQERRSLAEYAKEFIKLSRFAKSLAPTDEALIRKFRRGLNAYLHNALLTADYTSLAKLIDKATQMEAHMEAKYKVEREERQQKRKKSGQQSRQGKGSLQSLPPRPSSRLAPTQTT